MCVCVRVCVGVGGGGGGGQNDLCRTAMKKLSMKVSQIQPTFLD